MSRELVSKLIADQQANKWSDRVVAEMLGVTRSRWQYARTHPDQVLGRDVLEGISRSFPQYIPDVVKDLQGVSQ